MYSYTYCGFYLLSLGTVSSSLHHPTQATPSYSMLQNDSMNSETGQATACSEQDDSSFHTAYKQRK